MDLAGSARRNRGKPLRLAGRKKGGVVTAGTGEPRGQNGEKKRGPQRGRAAERPGSRAWGGERRIKSISISVKRGEEGRERGDARTWAAGEGRRACTLRPAGSGGGTRRVPPSGTERRRRLVFGKPSRPEGGGKEKGKARHLKGEKGEKKEKKKKEFRNLKLHFPF